MAEIIIALDTPDSDTALRLARDLLPLVVWYKVGLELFVSAGPAMIHKLKELNQAIRIFLDLKFYDIPNTAAKAAAAACALGVDMLTIHSQGGKKMCEAVMRHVQANPNPPLVMGVTALTSFATGQMPGICLPVQQYGLELATLARDWGLNGVICSPQEAKQIKSENPRLLCVCPGIRPMGHAAQDQARVAGPAEAAATGADFLVIGRPITQADNPVLAAERIIQQLQH